MSIDNNNSSTSTQDKITCHYRNSFEQLYWEMVESLDSTPEAIGKQFHHVVPNCLLKRKNRKFNKDGVYVSCEEHETLHHLLAESYKDNKNYFFRLSKCLIQWSNTSASAKARVIGAGPTSGHTGRKLSEDHKRKISESGKGKIRSESTKAKIGQAHKGKPKPNAGMRPYQLSRPWRHPRVSGRVDSQKDWSKSQELYEYLSSKEVYKKSKAQRELGFNSRRTLSSAIDLIEKGWVPGLDIEWVNDFVMI